MRQTDEHFAALLDTTRGATELPSRDRPGHPADERAWTLYSERRERDRWFGQNLFWEPGWDLLLYLYDAAETGNQTVSARNLLAAPFALSEDSMARWLDMMEDCGLLRQNLDATVSLTPKAKTAIVGYFDSTQR